MKSCPTCNRTFGDEMVFCLVDGAILSAPFDPNATRQQQNPKTHEPAPTELINTHPAPDPLPPTVADPAPTLASPAPTLPTPATGTPTTKVSNSRRIVYVGLALTVAIIAVLVIAYVRSSTCPTLIVRCFPSQDYAICTVSPLHGGFGTDGSRTSQALASLNVLTLFQQRRFADSVKVNWTSSKGVLGEPYLGGEFVRIETPGPSGQMVNVTATLTGLGTFCSNTASTQFKVGEVGPAR